MNRSGPSSCLKLAVCILVAAGAAFVAGCRSGANPPPVAAGGQPAGVSAPGSGGAYGVLDRTNPVSGDPVALRDGRRLFLWYNCYGCHGGHGGGGMGPSLRDSTWRYGGSDDQIFASISQGRPKGMPAWGAKVPDIQIWELVAYIRSLHTSSEPDPPEEPADEVVGNTKQDAPGTPIAPARRP